jgi:hypothetical protein
MFLQLDHGDCPAQPENGENPAVTWDFPNGFRPTTAIGLSDESIADREVRKRVF